jgi:hypothetical protein
MLGRWIERLPWWVAILAVLTLGLAPHVPEPHVWEKLRLLASGTLTRPVDIFDLAMHGVPWLLAAAKLGFELRRKP